MSWEACAWAMRKGKDYELEPSTRFVMLTLANYADKEGNDIYPSLSTLTLDTGFSESTVRRHIKTLRAVGLLDYGDQTIVTDNPRYRNDKLPKVYRFLFEQEGKPRGVDFGSFGRMPPARTKPRERGVTVTPGEDAPDSARGVTVTGTGCHTGVHSDTQTYNPLKDPLQQPEQKPEPAPAAPADETADEQEARIEAGRRLRAEIAARNAQRRQITHRPMTTSRSTTA